MARAKHWGDLTERTREKYAALGLDGTPKLFPSREAMRKAYNRGTWSPGSRYEERRIPSKFRGTELEFLALDNMRSSLGGRSRWSDADNGSYEHIERNIQNATDVAKVAMAHATEHELVSWAKAGSKPNQSDTAREREALAAHPGWKKKDVGFFDSNQKWHSIFWYHSD